MTNDDLILGIKKDEKKIELKAEDVFSVNALYKIKPVGGVESIENGELLLNILPVEDKQKLLSGNNTIFTNGLEIERVFETKVVEEPTEKPAVKTVKKKVAAKKVK